MSKLFVITFKRPALPLENKLMGLDTAYDCEAISIPEVAEIRHKDALNKYEDVEMFECEDHEYIEFVKNDAAYAHFTRTGEHSMKPLEEGYKPPFALLVLDGDDNKWKPYKALDSDNFDKEDFLAKANKQVFPNKTYINNYVDAKVVPNSDIDHFLEEDVYVGTESHTETIYLALEMQRPPHDNNISFDYNVDIDDVGQIVFTPVNTLVSFVDIRRLAGYDSVEDTIDGDVRRFSVSLTANMISDCDNFDWFCDIDEIGQAIITPDAEATSFLTVSVNDSLNLVTECTEQLTEDSKDTKELCEMVIDDLEECLKKAIQKAQKIESYFDELNIHSADIEPYMINYFNQFIQSSAGDVSVSEFRRRLDELNECKISVTEDVDEIERNDIIDRFMKGEIAFYSDEGNPETTFIHLDELDSIKGKLVYEYYYDESTDSIISYSRVKEEQHD